jgi:hypothetical protein
LILPVGDSDTFTITCNSKDDPTIGTP